MKWSLSMILIMAMVLVVISVGFTQEKVTITVQDFFMSGNNMKKIIDEVIVEFEKDHPGVKMDHVAIPFAQLLPVILQQALTKTVPDITMGNGPWYPQLIKAGVYKDIIDKVKEWGWENWEDFYKINRDVTSSEGKIYGFQVSNNNVALFYRKDLLDKAGIANPPETWQELKEASKKIREVLNIYGFAFDAGASDEGTWQFEPFLWSNGGNLLELDQPEAIETLQFLTDMVKEGYTPRDVVNVTSQGDLTQWFINGEVAMMVNGSWEFGWHLTEDVMQELGDVHVALLPVPEKGMRPIVPSAGECFGISSNIDPAKYDLAWEFLKLLVSSDNNLRLSKSAGCLPTRVSAGGKILAEKPNLKPFLEQLQYGLLEPSMGGGDKYPEVSSTVWVAVQKALTGIATPEEALKEAARTIQGIFSPEDYEMYKQLARKLLQEASGK